MSSWAKWRHESSWDRLDGAPMVAMVRFYREDGLDPRVDPEPEGTHLERHVNRDGTGRREASCGKKGPGFSDYGPLDGITCPDCAATLAAQLIKESAYG